MNLADAINKDESSDEDDQPAAQSNKPSSQASNRLNPQDLNESQDPLRTSSAGSSRALNPNRVTTPESWQTKNRNNLPEDQEIVEEEEEEEE